MDIRRLPNETTLRFLLLIAAVVSSTLAVAESLWYTVFLSEANEVLRLCGTDALCRRAQEHERVLWVLASGALVLLAGLAAAALGSLVRRRTRRLVPVPAIPVITDVVARVLGATGLERLPVLRSAKRPTAQARADGITSTYVEVGTNWMGLAATNPARARAVLHHEVAHIRARDIFPSRASLWLTNVFVAYAVVCIALTASSGVRTTVEALLRVTVAVGVVMLARVAVLRAREHAADIEAAAFEPEAQALNFAAGQPATRWFSVHPSPVRRREIVLRPALATRLNVLDGLLVGITASLAAPVLSRLWRGWFQFGEPSYWAEIIGWGVVGALLGAWSGIMVLRAVSGARAGGVPVRLGAFSWLLAGSVVVGRFLYSQALGLPIEGVPTTPAAVITLLVLAFGVVAVVHWLHGFVDWWLDLEPARHRTAALAVPVVFATVVGAGVLGVLGHLTGLGVIVGDGFYVVVQVLLTEGDAVVALPAVAILAALLLVLLRVRTGGPLPAWLDRRTEPAPAKVAVAGTFRIGALTGAAAAVAFAIYTFGWHPTEVARDNWFVAGSIGYASQTIVGGVVAAGAVAAALAGRKGTLQHTAIAAAVGSVCATAGAWLVRVVDSGRVDFSTLLSMFFDVLLIGVVGGLVGSAIVLSAWRTAHRAVGGALVAVTAAVTVGLGVAALGATPSVQQDFAHYNQVFESVKSDLLMSFQRCGSVDTKPLQSLLRDKADPLTPQVRELHDVLLSTLALCEGKPDLQVVLTALERFDDLYATMSS